MSWDLTCFPRSVHRAVQVKGERAKNVSNCSLEKEKFDKELQPFSLERSILMIVNVYLDVFFFFFKLTFLTKNRNI